jgi:hypothetical protein
MLLIRRKPMADLKPMINCRIQVEAGGVNKWIWVEGFIKSKNADGTMWVRVPKADQLYLCNDTEVFVSLSDVRIYNEYHKL